MLKELEERYSEEFKITQFAYNKSRHRYEAGVVTDQIKEDSPAFVSYRSDEGVFDSYYSSLYAAEITDSYEEKLQLFGDKFIFSYSMIDLSTSSEKVKSYEEAIDFMRMDEAAFYINVFYVINNETPEQILDAIIAALQQIEHPEGTVRLAFVCDKEELQGEKYDINRDYALAYDRRTYEVYEVVCQIKKRDNIVTLSPEEKNDIIANLYENYEIYKQHGSVKEHYRTTIGRGK